MAIEQIIRTKLGVQALDKALNGGVPQGNIVLISGGTGTGKSTFCLEYIINGATLFGEKGLYVSTEQNKAELYKQAAGFNWKLEELEQKNLVKVIYFDITCEDGFLVKLNALVQEFKPKRLVIDSLTTLTDSLLVSDINPSGAFSMVQIAENVIPVPRTEQIVTKNLLYTLFKGIKKFGVTTFLITEMPEDEKSLSADGVSEFIADGVIALYYLGAASTENRSMLVRKMRYTDHGKKIIIYNISSNGLEILPDETYGR